MWRKTMLRQLLLSTRRQEASGLVKHGIDLVAVFHLELKEKLAEAKGEIQPWT
jgi:hypothetical protein